MTTEPSPGARKQLGLQLRKLRVDRGISIEDACKRMDIPPVELAAMELGQIDMGLSEIGNIAQAYQLSEVDKVMLVHMTYRLLPSAEILNAIELLTPEHNNIMDEAGITGSIRFVPRQPADGIVISYRRSDQSALAGRLYDKLVAKFGESRVFMDVGSIEPGLDFRQVLEGALSRCKVLIAVIGKDWATATNSDGGLRLDDPDDLVRIELETALKRNIRVIPVLVDGTPMPRTSCMPTALESFALRNAFPVWNVHFNSNIQELITTLERVLQP